ncbi:MAG: hypothetical protein GXP27_00200 [Planctomycetes bacterium]|nr:hypothetical protein [Planctomycetota bacterium]
MRNLLLLGLVAGGLILIGSPQAAQAGHHRRARHGHLDVHHEYYHGFHYDYDYHHRYSHHYYGLARRYYRPYTRGLSIYTPSFGLSIGSGYYHHPAFRGGYYRYRRSCW